jgi:hypothetical protein
MNTDKPEAVEDQASHKPTNASVEASQGNTPTTPQDARETPQRSAELSLDDLLDAHLGTTENHKGLNYQTIIEGLPDDAKKLVSNLRNDYRRKTTSISEKRKELEAREKVLLSRRTEEDLRSAMDLPENIDLYDPEGLKRYINAKAAEQVNALLEPARKQLAKDTRLDQVKSFQKEHPDIVEMKEDISKLISEKNMTIEDAYFTLKGRAYKAEMEKKNQEILSHKAAQREVGYKVNVGRPTTPAKRKFKTAYEAYTFLKQQGHK